jgi:hypothetical protein
MGLDVFSPGGRTGTARRMMVKVGLQDGGGKLLQPPKVSADDERRKFPHLPQSPEKTREEISHPPSALTGFEAFAARPAFKNAPFISGKQKDWTGRRSPLSHLSCETIQILFVRRNDDVFDLAGKF